MDIFDGDLPIPCVLYPMCTDESFDIWSSLKLASKVGKMILNTLFYVVII